jgi:hypothetical protein
MLKSSGAQCSHWLKVIGPGTRKLGVNSVSYRGITQIKFETLVTENRPMNVDLVFGRLLRVIDPEESNRRFYCFQSQTDIL